MEHKVVVGKSLKASGAWIVKKAYLSHFDCKEKSNYTIDLFQDFSCRRGEKDRLLKEVQVFLLDSNQGLSASLSMLLKILSMR